MKVNNKEGAIENRQFCLIQKKKALRNKYEEPLVENAGFEPAASCMPCKRSSQLS